MQGGKGTETETNEGKMRPNNIWIYKLIDRERSVRVRQMERWRERMQKRKGERERREGKKVRRTEREGMRGEREGKTDRERGGWPWFAWRCQHQCYASAKFMRFNGQNLIKGKHRETNE